MTAQTWENSGEIWKGIRKWKSLTMKKTSGKKKQDKQEDYLTVIKVWSTKNKPQEFKERRK